MSKEYFLYVGSWNVPTPSKPGGITLFRFSPESGTLSLIGQCAEELNVGGMALDVGNRILYVTDERLGSYGVPGGSVLSFTLSRQTGIPEELYRVSSLGAYPSKLAIDPEGDFLAATNLSGFSSVCRSFQREDGSYGLRSEYDESSLVLFRIDRETRQMTAIDLTAYKGESISPLQTHPMVHSVTVTPDGKQLLVCDRGADCIYLYRLDRQAGRVIRTDQLPAAVPESGPRYSIFHPELSCFYYNCELQARLCVCRYTEDGRMQLLQTLNMLPDGMVVPPELGLRERPAPSDLVLSPDSRHLYAAIRILNQLVVYDVDPECGLLTLRQRTSCGGSNPRALAVDPTGHFLLCANLDSEELAIFAIRGDGSLSHGCRKVSVSNPGSFVFTPAFESA